MFWKNKELEELREIIEFETQKRFDVSDDLNALKRKVEKDLKDLEQKFKDFEQFVFVALSQEQNKRIGLGAKIIEMQGILNNKPIETDQAFEIAMHFDNNSLELPIKNKPSEKKKRSPEYVYELPKELKL